MSQIEKRKFKNEEEQEKFLRNQLKAVVRYKVGIMTTPDFGSKDVRVGGYVTVVPRSNNKHRDYFTSFRTYPDHREMIMWGYPQDQDMKTQRVTFRQIRIDISRVFDLWNINDIMEFYVLQHHYDLLGHAKSELMVDDPEEKAVKNIKKQNQRVKADAFITEAGDDKIRELVRVLLGIDPTRTSILMCRSHLAEICNNNPQRILEKMEDRDFEYESLFAQLKENGLIKESISRGWLYRDGIPMGNTKEGVVAFMKNDPEWTMTLRRELEQKNKDSSISNGTEIKKSKDKSDKEKSFGANDTVGKI